MSYYYPQASVKLRILLEDFKLTSDASVQDPIELNVVPRNVTINRNDYKTTDTFSMELDFKSFPFDPRSIRYCGVVIYVQDMEGLYDEDGSRKVIVPGESTKIDPSQSNAVFAGFVDEDCITLDENKRTVKFDGRDFTALLIDQKYQSNTPLLLTQPLNVVLAKLLNTFKATQQITVVNKTGNSVLPTIGQFYPGFADPLGAQRNSGTHESYWEIIQDIVARAGLICYIDLDTLVLTTPKNQAVNDDDIKFIYGKNVKNLMLKRKLGRLKGFNILVRSRVGKKILTAKIPEEATVAWGTGFGFPYKPATLSASSQTTTSAAPAQPGESRNFDPVTIPVMKPDGSLDKDNPKTAPYIAFSVPNIASKAALIQIGQTTYEQYSLQQLEGSFETKEMLGRGQTKENNTPFKQYDLTKIPKGQTICIEIDSDDIFDISRLATASERFLHLIHRGYSQPVATLFAKTIGRFSPRFFSKNYSMTIDQDSGFLLKMEFINIVDLTQRNLP